jgi:hypothetical protein
MNSTAAAKPKLPEAVPNGPYNLTTLLSYFHLFFSFWMSGERGDSDRGEAKK